MKFYPSADYILVEEFKEEKAEKGKLDLPGDFLTQSYKKSSGLVCVRVLEDHIPPETFSILYSKGTILIIDVVGLETFVFQNKTYNIVHHKFVRGCFYEEE